MNCQCTTFSFSYSNPSWQKLLWLRLGNSKHLALRVYEKMLVLVKYLKKSTVACSMRQDVFHLLIFSQNYDLFEREAPTISHIKVPVLGTSTAYVKKIVSINLSDVTWGGS